MKAKLRTYKNGASAQRNNRRVVVVNKNGNIIVEVYSKCGGKFTDCVQMRGDFYLGQMKFSAETFELFQMAIALYLSTHEKNEAIA